ncbi:hypothetical protein EVG20_g11241 [Dentipellis fragilis]|uniref:Uncharacterized protein n=1 Tax=Dentipellis fragilis TaxID=205917 RepID=A0A4Y9XLJ6_9AGAM|nr:hypothetical protein EVG20_g11241 [Dentipellis fragilis]
MILFPGGRYLLVLKDNRSTATRTAQLDPEDVEGIRRKLNLGVQRPKVVSYPALIILLLCRLVLRTSAAVSARPIPQYAIGGDRSRISRARQSLAWPGGIIISHAHDGATPASSVSHEISSVNRLKRSTTNW